MMVAFWVLVSLIVVWVVRSNRSGGSTQDTDPLRILDERFARGEIDPEEYNNRRAVLQARQ